MSEQDIVSVARQALAAIAEKTPGHVHAARPGHVAGAVMEVDGVTRHVLFRRTCEGVQLEIWRTDYATRHWPKTYPLPAELQVEAGRMLDTLK